MRLAIVGAGALGSLYGFMLSRAPGVELTLVERSPRVLEALRTRGLRATLASSVYSTRVRALGVDEASCCHDVVLVMVKAYDTASAAPLVSRILDGEGIAVTLQNGLGNREVLARFVGEERVVQGVSTWGASLKEPGHVIVAGKGETIIGKPSGSGFLGVFERFAHSLERAGLNPRVVDDIETHVWRKLIVNTVVNTLTGLLRVRNGFLTKSTHALSLARRLFEEAYLTALLEGASLGDAEEEWGLLIQIIESTGDNLSSMLQDIRSCRATEAESIIGEVFRRGRRHGLEMKYTSVFLELLRALIDREPGDCLDGA